MKTCDLHKITYNDKLDPGCPQCALQGTQADQLEARPGEFGMPKEE